MKKFLSCVGFCLITTQAFANGTYGLDVAISPVQANDIVSSIVRELAPSGTKVTNVSANGSFEVNDQNALVKLDLTALKFKVSYLFFNDNATISMTVGFNDGDCANPIVTKVEETGDSSFIDGKIRDYLNGHKEDIVKNYLIKKTDFVKWCRVLPALEYPVEFN